MLGGVTILKNRFRRMGNFFTPTRGCHCTCGVGSALLLTSARLFGQLFRNLVYNAIKHGATNSTINLHVYSTERSVEINVSNKTQPNSETAVNKLLEALNHSSLEKMTHTGLGLERILDATKKLSGTIRASLEGNTLTIIVSLPTQAQS